ncbi:hypothetical protein EDD36DRAFT_157805 [Exophiala viscosa]|uniref:Fe2OG dioxygenase domain-containing protein n=1 Tax=Exophiala viscosa TaxID=2486360 RepID=A0AAN6E324_9EURO|nr:hypothetical protein EDD36DRAFT_157805 [Exophiala viscosa]
MGKNKAKRALQSSHYNGPATKKAKISAITTPPPDAPISRPQTLNDLDLTHDDLEISVDVLNTLAENPGIIKSKVCKELRTAVFTFRQACTTGVNASVDSNLTSRISGALADENYVEARILLAEMRIRGQAPKLGALCRWTRDLDVVGGLQLDLDDDQINLEAADIVKKSCPRKEPLVKVLDSILRVVGPVDCTIEPDTPLDTNRLIISRRAWNLRDTTTSSEQTYASVLNSSIYETAFGEDSTSISSHFRVIETIPGLQRKPPNLHPAILYASKDNTISLIANATTPTHHTHPIVPNLHLFHSVLTSQECTQIIAAAETMGFTPDAPIRAPGEESSILAHNFYWVADPAFCTNLWDRVAPFVPSNINGQNVRGLNRRFRVYRYVPGAEYRAHIDGAWPPSGIDLVTDTYIYDDSPKGSPQSSLFTFLIYLNDEFDAGETTFFLPSVREGVLNSYPVKPVQGSILMFPHGETEGSLLHQGTGVARGKEGSPSAKYVIRTDVLYDVGAGVGSK